MPAVATAAGLPNRLGKFDLLMPLAAGGMARIFIGRTTGIGSFERHVVLKMILPEKAQDHVAVQMFLDEARLSALLNHQNVAQVFEVGEDGGIHYLAMEFVHGQDLRALLAKAGGQGKRVPLELALTIVTNAAAGLNHAHERRGPDGVALGIVHRDVSPSNIMIGYDGSVKLLDFGIAKATSRSVETQSGIIKGKFAYMAPEQCRGREVDRRSDVFSLGIILYELTTQHRCFRADNDFDTMHRIVTGDVVRPSKRIPGYPPALEAIVMKALAVDANTRYQSAGDLLEAIEAFAAQGRMSLSTMTLGRFMRELFGEQLEPWVTGARGSSEQVLPPREATVSSTHPGSMPDAAPVVASAATRPTEMLARRGGKPASAAPPDTGLAHATIIDLPAGNADAHGDHVATLAPAPEASSEYASWSATSGSLPGAPGYQSTGPRPAPSFEPPLRASPAPMPAGGVATAMYGPPSMPAPISTQGPRLAFSEVATGSSAAPAIPSTKHGYERAPGKTHGPGDSGSARTPVPGSPPSVSPSVIDPSHRQAAVPRGPAKPDLSIPRTPLMPVPAHIGPTQVEPSLAAGPSQAPVVPARAAAATSSTGHRLLYIGLLLAAVGVAIVLGVALGWFHGHDDPPAAHADPAAGKFTH